jgi:hypothetical protein
MKLLFGTLALTILAGYVLGGRLTNLGTLRIRWAPLAIVGLVMQVINPPGDWPLAMLIGSFLLLSTFVIANIRVAGFALILIGVSLNFLVIGVNAGMPVSQQALVASGQGDTVGELTDGADSYVKHHLASDDDRLLFLGDVIALRAPIAQAISVGDVLTYGGVAIVIVAAMRRRSAAGVSPPARGVETGEVFGARG